MRFDKTRQWIGAIYSEDLDLIRDMLAEDPSLADTAHTEFDDPFRKRRFPVATLLFACFGPPNQQVADAKIRRVINFDMIKVLVESGADTNIDSAHGFPLCYVRDEQLATYLIEHGADVNRWHEGGYPLFRAIVDPQWTEMLLRFGADPTQAAPDGETVLHRAAGYSPKSVIKNVIDQLTAAGAQESAKTSDGKTFTDIAAGRGITL